MQPGAGTDRIVCFYSIPRKESGSDMVCFLVEEVSIHCPKISKYIVFFLLYSRKESFPDMVSTVCLRGGQ